MKILLNLQFLTCKKYSEHRSTVKNCNYSKLQFFKCTSTVIPLHIFAVYNTRIKKRTAYLVLLRLSQEVRLMKKKNITTLWKEMPNLPDLKYSHLSHKGRVSLIVFQDFAPLLAKIPPSFFINVWYFTTLVYFCINLEINTKYPQFSFIPVY